MKAIVYDRYGGAEVLRAEEVEAPVAGEDEVLIRVHASSVNTADWFFLTASPWIIRPMAGLFRPKQRILGRDVAGVVEAVGKRVTRLSPGDEVYGEIDGGAFAELAVAGEDQVVPKPENLTFEQAAAMPLAGTTALRGVRDSGKVEPGQRVLVNGASGAVGTFTVQIAKSFGAEVTAVCRGRNEEMVRSLGADRVVDYEREDFTKDETRYDVLIDFVASRPLSACRRLLRRDGVYVFSAAKMGRLFGVLLLSPFLRRPRVTVLPPSPSREQLETLRELAEAGKVAPYIEETYSLDEVPEALRRQGEGHARGKKVIVV